MIGIVILGLGLIMVATMFPVAWDRARDMSEVTARETMIPAVESTVSGLVPVAGPEFNSAAYAGDLIFDPNFQWPPGDPPTGRVVSPCDTRVHALHMQNIRVDAPRGLVNEDPWQIEQMPALNDGAPTSLLYQYNSPPPPPQPNTYVAELLLRTYHTPRIDFAQRLYPPMGRRRPETVDAGTGAFRGDDDTWEAALDTRRFCWAVFHRLRSPVGPEVIQEPMGYTGPTGEEPAAKAAIDDPRTFDIYYVTLRRSNSTNRYARQDPQTSPRWFQLEDRPRDVPRALPPMEDVVIPVAWRVQVQFPDTLQLTADATGVPTEIQVPPPNLSGTDEAKRMLVQMFPAGTRFIDEITGTVYRVAKRRVTSPDDDEAILTLDREVSLEDVDLPDDDWRCQGSPCLRLDPAMPMADPPELLRTVWVFPPTAEVRDAALRYPVFDGPSPVVGVDVRVLTAAPQ